MNGVDLAYLKPTDERWPQVLAFDLKPVEPQQLREELEALPSIAAWEDELGNGQAGFRLQIGEERILLELCAGGDRGAASKVVDAHVPAPEQAFVAVPTVEQKLAGALEALPDGPVSKKDLAAVIATLRGDA